jgi:6-phosphogluconolactonase
MAALPSTSRMVPSITAFSYDSQNGVLKEIEQVSAQPDNYTGTNNSGAEVVMHPSGKFLYASNRGADTVAVFAIDPQKGTLSKPAQVPTQGKTPRNFAVDPTGAYLFAANQDRTRSSFSGSIRRPECSRLPALF